VSGEAAPVDYVSTYAYACICVSACGCLCICICVCICIDICYIYMYLYMYMYVNVYVIRQVCGHIHKYMPTNFSCTCTYTYRGRTCDPLSYPCEATSNLPLYAKQCIHIHVLLRICKRIHTYTYKGQVCVISRSLLPLY
jgi:hypothetical protein